jgi:conjugal transfer pilin signal peptidase TrbI
MSQIQASARTFTETSWLNRARVLAQDLGRYYRERWKVWAMVILAVMCFHTFFKLGINVTDSLPQKLFIVTKFDHSLHKGDYVSFRWHGAKPYPKGVEFVKIVRGVPGDVVSFEGRNVFINGEFVATAKEFSKGHEPLALGPAGVIPPGKFFAFATHPDSLDSRYALTGWIDESAVLGRAYVLF